VPSLRELHATAGVTSRTGPPWYLRPQASPKGFGRWRNGFVGGAFARPTNADAAPHVNVTEADPRMGNPAWEESPRWKVKPPPLPGDPQLQPQPGQPPPPQPGQAMQAAPGANPQPQAGVPGDPNAPIPEPSLAEYPPPMPGEPIIPPPGALMPHEQQAVDLAHDAAVWPPVNAKPTGKPFPSGRAPYDLDGTPGIAASYDDPERAQSEKLANDLYRLAGVAAPESSLGTIEGKKAIFARQVPGAGPALLDNPMIRHGFAMDAILANLDVFGTQGSGVVADSSGQAHRVGNAGSLTFYSDGNLKPWLDGDVSGDIAAMRAHPAFAALSDADIAMQIASVCQELAPDRVNAAIIAAGFTGLRARFYSELLSERIADARAWALAHYPALAPMLAQQAQEAPRT
jgi:hypothetical protein